MRRSLALLLCVVPLFAAADPDFSGRWRLNETRSEIRALPVRPAPELHVASKEGKVHCEAHTPGQAPLPCSFSTDGREVRSQGRDWTVSTKTKWEGSALLLNAIHTSPQRQHTCMDRWKLSRDGNTLTIRRVVVSLSGGETESTLVYEKLQQ